METVTDRTSNPFGMDLPEGAVPGYGDANADFHVLGGDPLCHGGVDTGVPFTGSLAGARLQRVLHAAGFLPERYADAPTPSNCFWSYRYPTRAADDGDIERFVDAELRAIDAHVLLPVGDRATRYLLRTHTTQAHKLPGRAAPLHAEEVRGRGFLVVPVADPAAWTPVEETAIRERLLALLESDYRQTKGVSTRVG